MSNKNETRTLTATLRTAEESNFELAGTAVAYNTLSSDVGGFRERFLPGAFTRVLQSNPDVKALLNHDANYVLGRTTSGTLSLSDSPQGLNFVVRLDPNQQSHRDLHAAVKRQDISQCSFAFKPEDGGDDFEDVADERGQRFIRRTVRAAKLFDISIVTYPAYPQGTSVQARSLPNYVVPAPQRRNGKSLEQQYFELTGHEFVSDQHLRWRLAHVGWQLKREARELAADKQLREKLEAQGRRIAIDSMLEEMNELVN